MISTSDWPIARQYEQAQRDGKEFDKLSKEDYDAFIQEWRDIQSSLTLPSRSSQTKRSKSTSNPSPRKRCRDSWQAMTHGQWKGSHRERHDHAVKKKRSPSAPLLFLKIANHRTVPGGIQSYRHSIRPREHIAGILGRAVALHGRVVNRGTAKRVPLPSLIATATSVVHSQTH